MFAGYLRWSISIFYFENILHRIEYNNLVFLFITLNKLFVYEIDSQQVNCLLKVKVTFRVTFIDAVLAAFFTKLEQVFARRNTNWIK